MEREREEEGGGGGNHIPLLQILNAGYPLLRIAHHLPKQVRKARLAQLSCLRPIQRSVIDCLAVGGVPESWL